MKKSITNSDISQNRNKEIYDDSDFELNPLSKSVVIEPKSNIKIHYCNKKNKLINCKCCAPEHICCLNNCICVECMKKNIDKLNLKEKQLINKAGRIAYNENGEYHCFLKINKKINDMKGRQKKANKIYSSYYSVFFKESKILNVYKDVYMKYLGY